MVLGCEVGEAFYNLVIKSQSSCGPVSLGCNFLCVSVVLNPSPPQRKGCWRGLELEEISSLSRSEALIKSFPLKNRAFDRDCSGNISQCLLPLSPCQSHRKIVLDLYYKNLVGLPHPAIYQNDPLNLSTSW